MGIKELAAAEGSWKSNKIVQSTYKGPRPAGSHQQLKGGATEAILLLPSLELSYGGMAPTIHAHCSHKPFLYFTFAFLVMLLNPLRSQVTLTLPASVLPLSP